MSNGDINADGLPDAVVVIHQPTDRNDASNASQSRTLLLLVRGTDHRLHQAGQNDKIVPCEKCGGMFGDPVAYVGTRKGTVSIANEGGSGTLWSDEYISADGR